MGQLVFQSTAGGQTALVSPNPTANFALNVPAVNGNLVTTGDTGTVTNTMLASNVYTAPGTIGSVTPNTGAFTTLSASSTVSGIGFNNYLASPPAIGGTTANTGKFTTLTTNSNVINGATSGTLTLAATAVAGTNTATFPAATGTVMVSGNMPAFSASLSANQTVNSGTTTKITFNTKQFDTNSCYDNSTNYRFTPTVAGYYQFNVSLDIADVSIGTQDILAKFYKNGSQYLVPYRMQTGAGKEIGVTLAQLIYMNGSTDYLEVYFQVVAATNCVIYTSSNFNGSMVRAA